MRLSIIDEVIVKLNNESADTTRLESNLRSGWDATHQRIPLAVETIALVHSILTEEQRAEIVEKMERRKERGGETPSTPLASLVQRGGIMI